MKESYIKQLIRILEDSDVNTIEISSFWGMSNIKLSKGIKNPSKVKKNIETNISQVIPVEPRSESDKTPPSLEDQPIIEDASVTNEEIEKKDLDYITAPLVGTFYSSPKPEDSPFVKKGDKIKVGQIICIIEAMKIFNEIESEYSGKIEKILINDSTPVEYDQDLIIISVEK